MDATSAQVLAFRLAGAGLAARAEDPMAALGSWGVQDSPPGAGVGAILVRTTELEPGWLDGALWNDRSALSIYNARTATALLRADDAPVFATALLPSDDEGYAGILGRAVPEQTSDFAEPVDLAVRAISDALDGRALSRDDLHEELRHRLPKALLPWCEGCGSHHARRGLLVMASLRGRLCLSGREGRQPRFSRTDQWAGWTMPAQDEARREFVRRYLAAYGPSTPAALAEWAGLAPSHARALWSTVGDELTEVIVDGGRPAWILTSDRSRLDDPPAAEGVRLLGPGDPLLQGRDRALLIPDEAVRKRLWTAIPTTGLVVSAGRPVATWKAKKAGKRLAVTVDAFGRAPSKRGVEDEADRLAPHRGCTGASVSWA